MTSVGLNSFLFLAQNWPGLYDLAKKAEAAAEYDAEIAAVRLRSYAEQMVELLFAHFGIQLVEADSLNDRLRLLEKGDLLDRRLLSKLHTLRKFGNKGAHSKGVPAEKIDDLLVDAWSLGCWFCRLLRPDVEWMIRPYGQQQSVLSAEQSTTSPDRESTASTTTTNVLKFPEDRIRRIRDDVARAMATVDPRVRNLRTRMSIQEAFSDALNDDQTACIAVVDDFLANPDQKILLLKGDAGTGKTYIAQGIIDYLAAQGRACHVAAPTGRSAKIIGEKAEQEARTLHGLIYDFSNLKEFGHEDGAPGLETFKFYASVAANRDQANTVYVVDEGSLISDVYSESDFYRSGSGYLLQDLIAYVGFNNSENDRKIIFLGDPAQLSPVGMNTSPALDAEYLRVNFGIQPTEYQLRQVVRQKADSGVLRNVQPIRKGLESGNYGGLRFNFDADVQRLGADEIVPTYMRALADSKPDLPIIITRSNAEASEINHAVRAQLFPGQAYVTKGDRLLISGNTVVNGHFLANGEFVRVAGTEGAVERRSVTLRTRNVETKETEVVEVTLTFRDADLVLVLADGTEVIQSVKLLDDFLHEGEAGLSAEKQRALYVDFLKRHPDLRRDEPGVLHQALCLDPYFNAVRAKFGYAVTCHKAQGGEWKHVIVVCPSAGDPRNADYFRWLYTAMTRASGTLYLVNPPEVRIRVAGPDLLAGHPNSEPGATNSTPVSPVEAFRANLLTNIRRLLEGTEIQIEDVAHYPYQEAYFLGRAPDGIKMVIHYNGKYQVGKIAANRQSPFRDEVMQILAPLIGALPGQSGQAGASTGLPTRPFLMAFHNQLVDGLSKRDIDVASLKEQQWSQRYSCQRDDQIAVVDVFYDGKNRLKNCVPISPTAFTPDADLSLLREVLEVVTDIIV